MQSMAGPAAHRGRQKKRGRWGRDLDLWGGETVKPHALANATESPN
jgi:hypothetical protein